MTKPSVIHKNRLIATPFYLLIPFVLIYLVFWFIPLIQGFLISLRENDLMETGAFIGLDNYRLILQDDRFYTSLYNTSIYAFSSLAIILPLSLTLAHGLKSSPPLLKNIFMFFLLLPGLTSPTVLAFLFVLIFNGEHGILNMILSPLGIGTIDWIKDPAYIKASLVIQSVWRWTGFITYFLWAGLESIPKAYYELAMVEGAGRLKVLFTVTLPLLKNILLFVALFLVLDSFILFEGSYILLGGSGGTADAGLLFVSYIYNQALYQGNFGTAAAMSFSLAPVFLFVILGFTYIFKVKSKKASSL